MKWAVIYVGNNQLSKVQIPKLYIANVPDDLTVKKVAHVLAKAGYFFGDYEIRWANYLLVPETKWSDEVGGMFGTQNIMQIEWEMVAPHKAEHAITVRVPEGIWCTIEKAVSESGMSMNNWIVTVLANEANQKRR